MAVVLLGSAADPQIVRVRQELDLLGAPHLRIDTGRFPEEAPLSLSPEGAVYEGESVPVPRAVYVRGLAAHPLRPSLSQVFEAHPRRVIAAIEEKRALLESLLLAWQAQGARLVNPPEANAQHSRKPYQLHLLLAAALPVPQWITTNDGAALLDWMRRCPRAVYKPLAGGATVRMVEQQDLSPERLEQLAAAPVLFQQFIEGLSLRVYVVGEEVVAAGEIHSTHLDYRRGEDAVVAASLTQEESSIAIFAARATGMPFAGVDLIRAGDATRVLEVNPSPMFAVFEEKTGLNVAGPLARMLAGVS